ncbi:MAG: DNA-formamidopyrimidine glycosylase, partial [Candidatus Auribacterota bacterium]|nr:DNA-formamidopyrimidine glycosylase [Candidatus Auribacterota bacterium]
MPELPEVETIKRGLSPRLRGKVIEKIIIPPDPKGIRVLRNYPSRRRFIRKVTGRTIISLERRAKYLLLELESGETLIIHLGMSGQLLLRSPGSSPPRHARIIFTIAGAGELFLVDPRKFGQVYLYSREAGDTAIDPFSLGPEPLGKKFTPAELARRLENRRSPIKVSLLDQRTIAGLGNIYTDEALFRAGIHPKKLSAELTKEEIELLHKSIREVLREAIKLHGTSAADRQYVDSEGVLGKFQTRLNV